MEPLLSIIVPVYNMSGEEKLQYCMESLLKQTYKNYEILAIDDCSTDDSMKILEQYQKENPHRIRIFSTSVNSRQGAAKNLGLKHAQGEWVGFIDSDDWITEDMYEKLLKKAFSSGADIVGCDYSLVGSHTMMPGQVVHNGNPEQCGELTVEKKKKLLLDPGSLCVKVYKKRLFEVNKIRFPEGIFYEDNGAAIGILLNASHYEYIEEPMYYYYQHNTSTVHTITERRCLDRMEAGMHLIKEADRFGFRKDYEKEIEYQFTNLFYANTLFSYMLGVKNKKIGFIRNLRKEMKILFPEFQKNPYYLERKNEEERKLMAMHMKSNLMFYFYFRMLWGYRNLRKRINKNGV